MKEKFSNFINSKKGKAVIVATSLASSPLTVFASGDTGQGGTGQQHVISGLEAVESGFSNAFPVSALVALIGGLFAIGIPYALVWFGARKAKSSAVAGAVKGKIKI